jgi:phage shock protein PspC (stress-responsive transcriptional regulator)
MLAGVCNGLAAYTNIDPTFVRLGFVFLTMVWGTGVLVYIVMAIVVPEAHSPEEKAAASGIPATAQEFIRRAKQGYYEAVKGFPDRRTRREWRRQFKREMHGWGRSFGREMRWNAEQWRYNWHNYWAAHAAAHPGLAFALPFFSVLHGALTLLWISASVSLLATGAIFGMALPANVPVWLAAVLLLFMYGVLSAPLKLARRACYWGAGGAGWGGPFLFLTDAVVSVTVAVALVWLAVHFLPEVRHAAQSVPAVAHQAVYDVRAWWTNK